MRSGYRSGQTAEPVFISVNAEDLFKETLGRMFCAVIFRMTALGNRGDLIRRITIYNRKISRLYCNHIIVFIGSLVKRIGKGILRSAGHGLCSGNCECCAFTVRKSIAFHRYSVVGQRITVILFFRAFRSERHLSRRNGQAAGNEVDLKLRCHIIAKHIGDYRCAGNRRGIGSCIRAADIGGNAADGVVHTLNGKLFILDSAYRMFLTVIHDFIGIRFNINFKSGCPILNFQFSVGSADLIIRRIAVKIPCECVVRNTDDGP